MATVFLARHGQTAYNLEGRFQGQRPVPLDETGRAQAAELAERAAGYEFAALWCSPLLRARETADAVATRIGLRPRAWLWSTSYSTRCCTCVSRWNTAALAGACTRENSSRRKNNLWALKKPKTC